MAEEKDQTTTEGLETSNLIGQEENQATDTDTSKVSEDQTNTEEETKEKLIPIPSQKWREANQTIRELKTEIESLKTYQQTEAEVPITDLDDTATAIDSIANAVADRLSPRLSYIEKAEYTEALKDVASRPYSAELKKEIANNFAGDTTNTSVSEKLEKAYQLAVGQNIDRLLSKTSKESEDKGYENAYEKIAEKKSSETPSAGAKQPPKAELSPDDIRSMTPQEYNKQRVEIFRDMGLGEPDR